MVASKVISFAEQLEGTGKSMRHIKYTSAAEIDVGVLRKILKESLALDHRS